jgi:hypothetical protein
MLVFATRHGCAQLLCNLFQPDLRAEARLNRVAKLRGIQRRHLLEGVDPGADEVALDPAEAVGF